MSGNTRNAILLEAAMLAAGIVTALVHHEVGVYIIIAPHLPMLPLLLLASGFVSAAVHSKEPVNWFGLAVVLVAAVVGQILLYRWVLKKRSPGRRRQTNASSTKGGTGP